LIVFKPGSTGGLFLFTQVFRKFDFYKLPTIFKTPTLTFDCRAKERKAGIPVKANQVSCLIMLQYLEPLKDLHNILPDTIPYYSLKGVRRILL